MSPRARAGRQRTGEVTDISPTEWAEEALSSVLGKSDTGDETGLQVRESRGHTSQTQQGTLAVCWYMQGEGQRRGATGRG